MKINISDIIGTPSEDSIHFEPGEAKSIQMPVEYISKIKASARENDVFILEADMPVHKHLKLESQIKFMLKWHSSNLKMGDILKQYQLEEYKKTPMSKLPSEMNQRLSYIHALITDQKYILAANPFYNATKENLHMFHKMMAYIKADGKALVAVVSRTEEAFLVQQNIMRLNESGLKEIEVSEDTAEDKSSEIKKIRVRAEDKTIFVNREDIEYIESNDGKIYINISREKFVMESTLQDAEDKLREYGFYRCHRSYIVNLHKVKEIITWSKNTYSVVIDNRDETKLPLSRQKYNEIQELLVTI